MARELCADGVPISPSGVRKIWIRHGLETAYKRLKSNESHQETARLLTASQMERMKRGDRSHNLVRQRALGMSQPICEVPKSQLIVQVAAELFVKQGYGGTSLRQIAARAGLLPGSLYHHFPSKESLFIAVHREGFRLLIASVNSACDAFVDPWDRLEAAARTHTQLLLEGSAINAVTAVSLFSRYNPRLQRRLNQDRQRYETIFRELVEALPLEGPVDRSLLRLFLFGALNWALTWYRTGPLQPEQIARAFVLMLKAARTPASRHET
jgi:TetR/AcrR family transcriptional regulator, cholesterol catabolism regulator